MAREFTLSVVAPDRTVVEQPSQSLMAPAYDGYLGVWAGHEAMLVALKSGVLEYRDASDRKHAVALAGGGFMEITSDKVIVLADDAVASQDIDVKAEEAELEEARKALRGETSRFSPDEAVHIVDRALVRLKAARSLPS